MEAEAMPSPAAIAADPQSASHEPVLLAEVLTALHLHPGAWIVDGTLGGGGHAQAILQQIGPDGRLLGLDADPAAIRRVQARLGQEIGAGRLLTIHANFGELAQVATAQTFYPVDGILLDLGLSSFQLATAERGFAFSQDGPLDMRFDPTQGISAAELVNSWDERELADLLYRYGDEARSWRIARHLVAQRPFTTTTQLAQAVEIAVGGRRGKRIHPATQTFQALRIAVNGELEQLERVLPQALSILKPGGRLAVISFHSLEDRLVKQWLQQEAQRYVPDPASLYGGRERTPTVQILSKKPMVATEAEQRRNPRSRSAKLRVAEKL